jgi:(E)-4-hydroxy-3-methylbut-2-enyl-diphosphate synthase
MANPLLYSRFQTRVVNIGDLPLGGNYPVRVQSMTNTNTLDTESTVNQIIRMINAGCEYVRISTPGLKEAENLRNIKKELSRRGYKAPLIADVHFNPKIAELAAAIVEKVRINPGNYADRKTGRDEAPRMKGAEYGIREAGCEIQDARYQKDLERVAERIRPLIRICKEHGAAIRIGSNHGSLSRRILDRFGDTPEGMVASVMEFVHVFEGYGFHDLVLAMKASNPKVMIRANRLLVETMKKNGMNYPLHLGVTEAGSGEDGRLRSAVGIGSLLADGIGDTIRVSLTENPEFEIPVAYGILQAAGARISRTEFISCPSCSRTLFNIQEAVKNIKARAGHLRGMKIAIMGCIVNGPGEMTDAHYGYIGAGKGKVTLYKGQEPVKKNVDESVAVDELINLIREHGDWIDP